MRPACALWFPFVLANSLEKDIFSDLFYEAPVAAAASAAAAGPGADGDGDGEGKPCKDDTAMAEECGGPSAASEAPRDLMPPPKSMHASCLRQQTSLANGGDNAGDLSELVRARTSGGAGRRGGSRRPVAPRRRRC
ncbi:hypothetical protein DAI22_08g130516 [Oryza sativa Japonica Group]|nr:hypothetical protein DAI22_08g130516 [Oryza sativa Japonica Group]